MATAAPGRTTFQPRRQAGQKSGGEFAPKQVAKAAAPPPASFKDSDARRARNYRRAFANWLAAIRSAASEGVGTESLAHHWREANGIAAVAKSARDQAAMECIGATIDPEDPEAARLRCHVGRWKINWVKGLDPEACDKARAGFVEHASTAADCGEVEAMSRAVWADSAWSTSGLRDAGIEPTEVAYFNPRGYNVVPDPEDMATVCSGQGWGTGHTRGTSLSDAVSDAFSLGPPADRFLALAEFTMTPKTPETSRPRR